MGAAEVQCTDCLRIYIIVTELRLQTGPVAVPRPAAAIWPHLVTPPPDTLCIPGSWLMERGGGG